MATLFMSKQDRRKANTLKSCSNFSCNETIRFSICHRLLLLAITILSVRGNAETLEKAAIPAFPGAEGAGAFTSGGRDGKVFEVTNLNDAGPGATLPKRDSVDARIIEIVRTGKPTYKNSIIDVPSDVGGWPDYKSTPAPADSDHDGMPDSWEKKFSFNQNDSSDSAEDVDKDGYTNVEEWLNGTDPTRFVDYRKLEKNKNMLH